MSLHLTLVLRGKHLKIVIKFINVVTSHSKRSSFLNRKSPNIPHTETVDFVWGFNAETRLIAAETQSDFGRKHPGR
ncbi:hypothetical protein 13L [Ranavirus ambystoma1]|uniref:Uncharacterized protein n=1 Tax=Ranavirus ambystoma1 TaxID=265294 RepID=A0A0U2K654_9VIRU|nr:hypothetical protein 13L [Ambystoma tigrinum virus]QBL14613.1 hypothetical protein 13L [Ambystoma tigrinum virus]QBL14721.1 hypothetical protein 13L [Ambystoma tigrinum virus]QBL14829.1 hypothetical protein 13L [Ambystoma tigrinum virus]QBL14937.1 hypothetical protein 13L [Ambystoma tigrinum virus]